MDELIARLEKTTGRDRTLNGDIAESCGYCPADYKRRAAGSLDPDLWQKGVMAWSAPDFTGSTDQALTLVPMGWMVELSRAFDGDGEYWSKVILLDSFSIGRGTEPADRREVMAYGSGEPPRIICAAALKARAADQKDIAG